MLDIIRKKASAWGTKIVFGIIIIVFVFFFGYSRISQKYKGGSGIVAKVNGRVIGGPEFQFAYESTYKMYENMFKGNTGSDIEKAIAQNARRATIQQLVNREIVKELGAKMDMEPTNIEVVDAIKGSSIARGEDGKFDPFLYKQRILPYFAQKYGIDYETLIEEDLAFQNVQNIFRSVAKVPGARAIYDMEKTKYKFDVVEYESEEDAVAGKKGVSKKINPASISDRMSIFPSEPAEDVFEKVFALKKDNASLSAPVVAGGKWYNVKLIGVERPSDAQWEKDKQGFVEDLSLNGERQFFETWITSVIRDSKIKTYIE